jgi:glycosyltransferase involved in cell wall biosynthesis
MPINIMIVGPMPPPTHGMAVINKRMADLFLSRGWNLAVFDTSPGTLSRSLRVRLKRFTGTLKALIEVANFCLAKDQPICYFPMSGGYGLIFDVIPIAGARIMGARILLHHHSFSYIDDSFIPMKLVTYVSGPRSTHICLSPRMAEALCNRYNMVRRTVPISNAGLMQIPAQPENKRKSCAGQGGTLIVGMLANLSIGKGVVEFIEIASESARRGINVQFVLAGPFESDALKDQLKVRMDSLQNLQYRGAIYGDAKNSFYREIDVLLFPTKYPNEAEPIVVLDALAFGKAVVSYSRGCIGELLEKSGGIAYERDSYMLNSAICQLEEWVKRPELLEAIREKSVARFLQLRSESIQNLETLFARCLDVVK